MATLRFIIDYQRDVDRQAERETDKQTERETDTMTLRCIPEEQTLPLDRPHLMYRPPNRDHNCLVHHGPDIAHPHPVLHQAKPHHHDFDPRLEKI